MAMDEYRHLNNDGVTVGIEAIADQVVRLNYGFHRMISACVRFRLLARPDDALALAIRDVLNSPVGR